MVKGTTRRVILVRSPDPRVFEEAIFIVREDAQERGATPDDILKEAQRVASEYVRTHLKSGKMSFKVIPPGLYVLLGAAICGLIWALTALFLF